MTDPPILTPAARRGLWHTRAYRPWVLALLLLGALDWYVGNVFVPRNVVPIAAPRDQVLRDRTGGQNLGVLLRMAERPQLSSRTRVVMVGDSTVMSSMYPESTTLPANVQKHLRERKIHGADAEIVEFAGAGISATDASVLIAKALGLGADLVVYAVTPRIICDSWRRWSDADSWVLDPDVTAQLGAAYLARTFAPADLARSFMLTRSNVLRFRNEIRLWWAEMRYQLPTWAHPKTKPRAYAANELIPPKKRSGPLWTHDRCSLDASNVQIQALERIVSMCGASERCLLYHGPVNPAGTLEFEKGLLGDFVRLVQQLTREHDVPFRNYLASIGIHGFNQPKTSDGAFVKDAVHMNARGRRRLATFIAADTSRLLATRVAAAMHEPIARAPSTSGGS